MADKLLISVSAHRVSAAHWRSGSLAGCQTFAISEDGLAAFRNYLAQQRNLPVHLLVDAVEEDYRVESLPHAFGSERAEMVGRKLKQYYRNTPYCCARLLGRDAGKRRDDRYLFCALTNPGLIEDWLSAVAQRGLPVAGIHLLPTVEERLAEKLQMRQGTLLLVSADRGRLRLTLLRDHQLRISRLAQVDGSGAEVIRNYAEEISNTRLYLHTLRILTLDEPMSVLIVDHDDALDELAQIIARDNPNIECTRLGRQDLVSRVGIAAPALDKTQDALHLHLLGSRPPDANLAPSSITVGFRQHQARRGIHALTATVAIAVSVWCGFNWYQIFEIRGETDGAKRETAQLQSQYLEATRRFPAAPTSAENLRRAVEISQRIGTVTSSPETAMHVVSRALDASPAIALRVLGWKYGRTPMDPDSLKAPAAAPGDAGGAGSARIQSGLIEGEVRPFNGDYRAAIETINRFAEVLLRQPEVAEVKVVKLPLNISPSLSLSGNTTDSPEQAGKAEFKLLMLFKRGP